MASSLTGASGHQIPSPLLQTREQDAWEIGLVGPKSEFRQPDMAHVSEQGQPKKQQVWLVKTVLNVTRPIDTWSKRLQNTKV